MAKFDPETPFLFAEKKKKGEEAEESPFYESGGVVIWKMASFSVPEKDVDDAMKRVQPSRALVLDLRGNGGGREKTLLRLLGYFFDYDVKLGEIKRRSGTKQLVAKGQGDKAFAGRLFVLVDSNSASAAELFARTIQIEKRGTVLGDRSSGKVMRSILHGEVSEHGAPASFSLVPFTVSITDADITMSDGKGLEGQGVAPDELLLPTRDDLARGLDPALSRAASLAGVALDPQQAGALFPRLRKFVNGEKKNGDDDNDKDSKDNQDGKEDKDKNKKKS
jgi:C-terminal processing protease CtpA/Prc